MTAKLCLASTLVGALLATSAARAAEPNGAKDGNGLPGTRAAAPGIGGVGAPAANSPGGRNPAGNPDSIDRTFRGEERSPGANAIDGRNREGDRANPEVDRSGSSRRDAERRTTTDDQWRFTFHNNHWWYWLPDNRWVIWYDGRWIDYDPATYAQYYPMPYQTGYRGNYYNDDTGTDDWYYDDGDYYYYRRSHAHGDYSGPRGGEMQRRGDERRGEEQRGEVQRGETQQGRPEIHTNGPAPQGAGHRP